MKTDEKTSEPMDVDERLQGPWMLMQRMRRRLVDHRSLDTSKQFLAMAESAHPMDSDHLEDVIKYLRLQIRPTVVLLEKVQESCAGQTFNLALKWADDERTLRLALESPLKKVLEDKNLLCGMPCLKGTVMMTWLWCPS